MSNVAGEGGHRVICPQAPSGELLGESCPICNRSHREELRSSRRTKKRILIAEDEPSIANLMAYNLEQAGYEIEVAADGAAALDSMNACPPDLLILDLLLPLRSGWQVLRHMRASAGSRLSAVPVVVVSALACDRLARELSASGAQRLLGKPFSVTDLCAAAEDLLAEDPAADASESRRFRRLRA